MLGGFKNFLLRGSLVDLAVAVIIGTAFAAVVEAFTAWLTGVVGGENSDLFANAELGDLGYFINQVVSFVILAAVVYFLVVVPYTRAKEKYFPSPAPGTPEDTVLLRQIRDALTEDRSAH